MRRALNTILFSIAVGICFLTSADSRLIGDCRDEHGCYTCAGYMWCDGAKQCVQKWTANCISESDEA